MRISLALILLSLAACSDEVREATVVSHLNPCMQVGPNACMKIVDTDGTLHGTDFVDGFDFTWGRSVTMRYSVEEVGDPPADGSSQILHLEEIVAVQEEAAGTAYEQPFGEGMFQETWFEAAVPGVVEYLGVPVACESAVCDQLVAAHAEPYRVTFEHTGTVVPLRAVSVAITP